MHDNLRTTGERLRFGVGSLAAAILAAAPMLWILYLILRYAVPIPMLDDWEMVPIIIKAREGALTFWQLFEQQQEARTFFPKLLFLLFSLGKHWDSRVEMVFSVLLACLTALGIYLLIRQTRLSRTGMTVSLLLIIALIFSPAQHELWLLASGFPSFIPSCCVIWGLWIVRSEMSVPKKFWLNVGLAIFASFSLANGLLIWGLTFPVLFAMEPNRRNLRWLGGWWLACAICAAAYFWRFHPQPDLPEFGPTKPLSDYFKYLVAFLGSALGRSGSGQPLAASMAAGTVVLLGYLTGLVYTVLQCRNPGYCRRVLPWLAIATFAIGSGILAALGRIEWGVSQALESRYVAFSLYGLVGLIGLAAILSDAVAARISSEAARKTLIAVVALAAGLCFVFHARCAIASVPMFSVRAAAAHMGHGGVVFSKVLDTSKTIAAGNYPRPLFVRENAEALDRFQMLRSPLVRTTHLNELRRSETPDLATGWFDGLASNGAVAFAWGWAELPGKGRPADCVVLAYEDPREGWIAFALSSAVLQRPDVAETRHDQAQLWSGWRAEFPLGAVPKGVPISAWGLDAKDGKLYRLKAKEPLLGL